MKALRYEITDLCNLKCNMCWSKKWQHKDMSFDMASVLINDFSEIYPEQKIILTSREPLASQMFNEILEYSNDKKLDISILTNGILLTEKIAENIIKNNVKMLSFSLHGTPNYHDSIVGMKGAALKTIFALKTIVEKSFELEVPIDIRITTVISPKTKESIDFIVNIAKAFSAKLRIQHLMWHSDENKRLHKKMLWDNYGIIDNSIDGFLSHPIVDSKYVISLIEKTQSICKENNIDLELYPNLTNEQITNWYSNATSVFESAVCTHVRDSIRVRANGEFTYCQYIDYVYGNIQKMKLKEILNNQDFLKFSQEACSGTLTPLCQRCCHIRSADDFEKIYYI